MAAAEQLQKQIAAEPDATRKAGLERSLETLVTMLEQMTPEIERETAHLIDVGLRPRIDRLAHRLGLAAFRQEISPSRC